MHNLTPNQHLTVAREIRGVAPPPGERWPAPMPCERALPTLAALVRPARRAREAVLRAPSAAQRRLHRPAHRGTAA